MQELSTDTWQSVNKRQSIGRQLKRSGNLKKDATNIPIASNASVSDIISVNVKTSPYSVIKAIPLEIELYLSTQKCIK